MSKEFDEKIAFKKLFLWSGNNVLMKNILKTYFPFRYFYAIFLKRFQSIAFSEVFQGLKYMILLKIYRFFFMKRNIIIYLKLFLVCEIKTQIKFSCLIF